MVDYWKSNERHYCKYCNVWMQGDKISIKNHEQAKKHKDMMQNFFKKQRQAKSDAEASERDLQMQLQDIEEAAQAKYKQDMANRGASGRRVPPPPPPRPNQSMRQAPPHAKKSAPSKPLPQSVIDHILKQQQPTQVADQEDQKGIYEIRGQVYLEGKRHELQLVGGSACQIWVEDADEWLDALIEQVTTHQVPNTTARFRRFTVTYMLPQATTPTTEKEIASDRLRIKLPADMTIEAAEQMVAKLQAKAQAAAELPLRHDVDQSTGMGEWSTVSVVHIDENEEAIAKRREEEELEAAKEAEHAKLKEAIIDEYAMHEGDDALGAFNPWGGSYKGIKLHQDELDYARLMRRKQQREEEEIRITTDGSVDFKKKKRSNDNVQQKKKKNKRIRTDDVD